MTIIFIYVLKQNLTVSPICIYLSICLLPTPLLCKKTRRYIMRRKEHSKKITTEQIGFVMKSQLFISY